MKKNIFYVGALFLGLILGTSCSEEDGLVKNKQTLVEATINNPASRTTVSSDYKVVWSQDDAYTVWSSEDTQKGDLTLVAGKGSTTGSFTGRLDSPLANGDVALFPSVSGESKSYTFKSEYINTIETDAPMLGTYNGTSFSFNHLAAFIRVNANDLPAGNAVLTIESTNQALTGEATLTTENALIPSGEGKTITVTFDAVEGQDLVFDAPIPAQAYDKITLTLKVGGTEIFQKERALNAVVGNLYELTSTKQMTVEDANTVLAGLEDNKSLNVNISGLTDDATIAVPTAEGSVLNMDISNVAVGKSIIINNNAGESVGESQQNIGVNVANDESSAIDMTINTPTATVEVGNGYFTTVTAITATNTLIVKSGVNIGTLTINGGNVVIESRATVGTITNNVSGNTITEHVTSLDALKAAIGKGYNVILGADITSSEIIVINKPITLDGNGHTLTSSAGRAINVSGADGVTIKNLTINATGERAINIIQNATNVTIDHVTATAANYAVNVASSASEAVVNITNSDLTGLNVINIGASGAQIAVNQTKITCNDQTGGENYGAIALNADATNADVVATGVTFDIKGDSKQVSNGAAGASVSINGLNVPQNEVAKIEYGDYYYSFETLQAAVTFAKSNDKIQLISDVTLTESLEIPQGKTINLDLNGKTITIDAAGSDVIDFKNRGVLNIYGGSIVAANEEASRRCIYNYGTMTIGLENEENSGVTFTQTYDKKGAAINNEGTMTIHDATVNAVFYSIWTSGSQAVTTVNGGTFTTTNNVNIRDTWAYAVSVSNGAKFVVNGGSFEGNHGVIAVLSGSTATLNKGTFHCTAGYTGNSDWTLYANGTGSIITYSNDCTITNANNSGIGATEEGGVIQETD